MTRDDQKQLIFDELASHFEDTGYTKCITEKETRTLVGCNRKRARSLLREMVAEGVLKQEVGMEDRLYSFSGLTYFDLCIVLEATDRLPEMVKIQRTGIFAEGF